MDWDVLAHGYGLAEAPTIDVDGSFVFSDVLGGGVYRLDSTGAVTTVVPKRRGVGGIAIHESTAGSCARVATSCTCAKATRRARCCTSTASPDGTTCAPTRPVGSTPVRCASRCSIRRPRSFPGELWRVAPDGEPEVVFGDVVHANGVVCSADGRTIYLSDTRRRRVIVFDVERSTRREIDVSALGHPDGMALDENGAIWVALVSGGIVRLTPERRRRPDARAAVGVHDQPVLRRSRPLRHDRRPLRRTPSCAAACSARRSTSPAHPSPAPGCDGTVAVRLDVHRQCLARAHVRSDPGAGLRGCETRLVDHLRAADDLDRAAPEPLSWC